MIVHNATNGNTSKARFQRGNNQFEDIIGNLPDWWKHPNPDAKYPKINVVATKFTVI